jgi:hypothetical protein
MMDNLANPPPMMRMPMNPLNPGFGGQPFGIKPYPNSANNPALLNEQ